MAQAPLTPEIASIAPLPEAGRGVDHVGAAVELAGRGLLALVGAGEAGEVRAVGQVLDVDLDLGVGVLDALDVARLELLDQRGVHATDEADVVLLGLQRRGDTGEVGTLLLGEGDAVDVLGGRDRVDEAEADLRELRGDLVDRGGVGEADGDDRVVTRAGQVGQALLAVGLGVGALGGQLLDGTVELLLGLVRTARGGVVEGTVTAAADVVGEADLEAALAAVRRRGGRTVVLGGGAATGCGSHCESCGCDTRSRKLGYPAHGRLLHLT